LKELLVLFTAYLFFIIASIVTGAGIYLINPTYAFQATGVLLILSTIVTVYTFIKEFGGSK